MNALPTPAWRGPRPSAEHRVPDWTIGSPTFAADRFDRERRSSPWAGHRWFVYDLMTVIRPQLVVELGTHFGCSFFAMCQAVADRDLSTELVAIDTWQGDEHAGFYDDSVFDQFERWGRNSYPGVATRALRMTFDEALSVIDDGTIDLLHIDGLHTYEAVSHDFETWRPKLGPHATVMFHDVAEESGYESSRFWAEISDDSGGFTFVHNFGLGVLTADPALAALLASDEFAQIARYYPAQAAADVREMRIEDDGRLLQDRQAIVEHQAQLIADRDGALAAQAQMIDAKQALIEHQDRLIVDRDDALAAQARRIDDLVAGAADAVPHG